MSSIQETLRKWVGVLAVAVALALTLAVGGCASNKIYTEMDAPAQRDPRVEQMGVPEFLKPGATVKSPNLEALKERMLRPEQAVFVPVMLSEKQTLVTAADLREIAAVVGRIRPQLDPHVIRQVSMGKPEDGLWVLLNNDMGVQLYLVEGEWTLAGRYFLQH